MDNNFEPLKPYEKSTNLNNAKKPKKDEGIAILPVPEDAPTNPFIDGKSSSQHWNYNDENGNLLFQVYRFDGQGTEKSFFPYTYRHYKDGSRRWAPKGMDEPRPLYRLDELAKRLNATVLVCEGEKATDAAQILFPDFVATTSPNGSQSPEKANWVALKGRDVIIWPDNDKTGKEYAQKVAELALSAGANFVEIVQIPALFPPKWDLADPVLEGYEGEELQEILSNALPFTLEKSGTDFESLKSRAQNLNKNTHPDIITTLINDLAKLPSIHKRAIMEVIKAKCKIPFAQQIEAIQENSNTYEPDQLQIAQEIINTIGEDNIIGSQSYVWIWCDTGVWKALSERELKKIVQREIKALGLQVFKGSVEGVMDVLKSEIFGSLHEWNKKKDFINVKNGTLSWNGEQWNLSPHNRDDYFTAIIPHVFDPKADCPRFKQFLEEIFKDDPDSSEKASCLLEMIGYTLTCHADLERFIMLVGGGANGKSVLLDIIKMLLGNANVCAVQPSQFGNKFQRAHLHLKLGNLVTEMPEGAEIADAELKSIVSGELTTVEHKGKDPFDFCPYVTCWFGTNHMPHTRDFSDALFRRALVVPFNRTFKSGVNADPDLKRKLSGELSGILNLALQAYGKVLNTKNFTEPQSCIKAKQEWRLEADQVALFVDDKCVSDHEAALESGILYHEYKSWADDNGISRKLNHQNFTKRLQRLGFKTSRTTGGKRMITGIGWKN